MKNEELSREKIKKIIFESHLRHTEQDISITITRHYMPNVEFSLVSTGGFYKILRIYVEVLKMYHCVPEPMMLEAMFFRTSYTLILVPTIRIYPFLPPTINSRDTWVLKDKDVDLFGVTFHWPHMMAVDIVIKADVYDHVKKERKTIHSGTIRLQRNGEWIADEKRAGFVSLFLRPAPEKTEFVPADNPVPLSPYLYKLVTIDGFLDKVNVPEAAQLNSEAYREIATIFNCESADLVKLLEKDERDVMFGTRVHPAYAQYLIKVARVLHGYVNTSGDASAIRILFIASNPIDKMRLRLDEEVRLIDEALRRSEFWSKFESQQGWAVRVTDIQNLFLRYRPNILHFSGHGSKSGEIIMEDYSGRSRPVSVRALSRLFSVLKDNIRCVVLSACYSETQAQAIAEHIECVIGISKSIKDSATIGFATAFYRALGYGKDVKTAFDLGCLEIDLRNLGEQDKPKLLATKSDPRKIIFVK